MFWISQAESVHLCKQIIIVCFDWFSASDNQILFIQMVHASALELEGFTTFSNRVVCFKSWLNKGSFK